MTRRPNLKRFIAKLGPTDSWAGQCYGVACEAVRAGLVKGTPVYGHWTGPVHRKSMFYRPGIPFAQHGWVLLPDNSVCDPTRWVFEHVDPYIYFGEADHYDEGGNQFRMAMLGPPPAFNSAEKIYKLTRDILPADSLAFVCKRLGIMKQTDTFSIRQLHWIANVAPKTLDKHVVNIYKALEKLDLSGLIPQDNRTMVKRINRPGK